MAVPKFNLVALDAKARYSASMEDLETMACFLADHVIEQFPKKATILVIDFLSTGSPTQSASL